MIYKVNEFKHLNIDQSINV